MLASRRLFKILLINSGNKTFSTYLKTPLLSNFRTNFRQKFFQSTNLRYLSTEDTFDINTYFDRDFKRAKMLAGLGRECYLAQDLEAAELKLKEALSEMKVDEVALEGNKEVSPLILIILLATTIGG